ncbi:MAG: glucosamine-6-phosphate deaminase [Ilumatobacteraceae bacterium]
MEVVICPNAERAGELAAAKVACIIRTVGMNAVLGVATGSSPLALYGALARMVASGDLDLRHTSAFALDEYVGLPRSHPQSYAAVIHATVTVPLGLDPTRVHTPAGSADDIEEAAAAYEQAIRDIGGIDVQILGVGANGHIGFNEPTSSLASRTRIKTLTATTRSANARFFDAPEEVPTHCLTQGLGTIMDAREVVVVAQGVEKAAAIAAVVEGPVTAMCPGSVLQFHPRATIIIDEAAASQLALTDYYRTTFEQKPPWQRFQDRS